MNINIFSIKLWLLLVIIITPISCSVKNQEKFKDNNSLDILFKDYYEFKLSINPIEASKGGDYRYNNKVANYISDDYISNIKTKYKTFIDRILKIDASTLNPSDQLSLEVMDWDANIKLEGLSNALVTVSSPMYDLPTFELMPITQITSLQLYFAQLAAGQSVHPFKKPKDYEDWLDRVDDYLNWMDTSIAKMKKGMALNVVLPRILVERVIDQLIPIIDDNLDDHLFYKPIQLMPDHFTTIDREPLTESYERMIENKIKPKYRELKLFLENEYARSARTSHGLSDLPGGKSTYDYLIRLHTSTSLTAQEIHNLGLSEVERISMEMDSVKTELGFEGSLHEFLNFVRTDPKLSPYQEPHEVIDHFNNIHERMSYRLKDLFSQAPNGGFEVRRTESFRENSASAEYVPGTKDGSRPGIFYVPIPDVSKFNVLTSEALFLHEAIPGHHFQLSLQQENEQLPAFLHAEGMGVFVEGWALYAESLGKELGLYEDPYQYFGMLSMEMHRAIRLVVDSGIHAFGWSKDKAIEYSLNHEADSKAAITSEIERYMATPGQALSYKIGQLKIRELRNMAETRLDDQFDISEFHNQVLNSGSLPMELLEKKIHRWIEELK